MGIDIKDPIKNKEGGYLAALWRKVLQENNYINYLDLLVNRYINSGDKGNSPVAIKKKTKSSLITNITTGDMTFKTLLDLLFNFIKVKGVTLTIKLTFANGEESVHSVYIDKPDVEDDLILEKGLGDVDTKQK